MKGRGLRSGPDGQDSGEESPEESAPPEGSGRASKPGERAETGSTPSRRGAAQKISEQQAEIDRLVAEREAERARAAAVEASVRAQSQAADAARQAALARIGDDRDFATLSTKRMRGEVLSYEDDEKLSEMLRWREHAADLWEMTDRAHKTAIASGLGDRVERYGLDRQRAFDASLTELIDHAVAVTEARVKREHANELAELKAELKGLRTRAAAAQSPTVGGSSDGTGDRLPADGASPMDWFRAGARRQEAAGSSGGRRNGAAGRQ